MKLRAISHSRTGDKGDDPQHLADRVRRTALSATGSPRDGRPGQAHTSAICSHGEVVRYELPTIGALNFVLHGRIGGGVTRTLALDAHGKSLSSALLEMEIPDEDGNRQP